MKRIIIYFVFSMLFLGCAEEELTNVSGFAIKFGTECGWCAGQEYILVSNAKVTYLRNIPCGENKGTTNKSRDLEKEEWKAITNSFDYSFFKTLDYNECNVCVDGCDEIIEITENDKSHELRYSFSDKVEGMEILRQKLTALMEEMRNMH